MTYWVPFLLAGNRYLLVAMDYFTKWGEADAIPNMEASTVATVLTNEMFFRFSPPGTPSFRSGQAIRIKPVEGSLPDTPDKEKPYFTIIILKVMA